MVSNLRLTDSNLILTGYIEPNKPRIGRQVADELGMPFVDIEQRIEDRMGDSMNVLRETYGERHLQAIETEIMAEMLLHRRTVIRVNGSMLVHDNAFERLQATGPIICLIARLDAILQRIHLTLGARFHDPRERGVELGRLRREWAIREKNGLHELDVTDLGEDATVAAILALWQRIGITRS